MHIYLQRAVIFHQHGDEVSFKSTHHLLISLSQSLFSMLPEQR